MCTVHAHTVPSKQLCQALSLPSSWAEGRGQDDKWSPVSLGERNQVLVTRAWQGPGVASPSPSPTVLPSLPRGQRQGSPQALASGSWKKAHPVCKHPRKGHRGHAEIRPGSQKQTGPRLARLPASPHRLPQTPHRGHGEGIESARQGPTLTPSQVWAPSQTVVPGLGAGSLSET